MLNVANKELMLLTNVMLDIIIRFRVGENIMKKLLKAKEVAEILSCPVSTIYSFHQMGKLKGIKIGKLLRFDQDELEKLIVYSEKDMKLKNYEDKM